MTTPLNDRDVRLQATVPRYTTSATATSGLNVYTVTIYQRAATNVAPALPSATTTLTFATGALTGLNNGWSTTLPASGGGFLFASTGYASSANATDDIAAGEWVAARLLAQDGAQGTSTTGARGAGQYYATGSAWSDATAEAATPGLSVVDDLVTISNGTFAETRRYSGSAWVPISAVLNGALLAQGTVTNTAFAASIEPVTLVSGANPTTRQTAVIFNTSDGKSYRWNGVSYTSAIPTIDIPALTASNFATNVEPITTVSALGAKTTNTVFLTTDQKLYRWNGSSYTSAVAVGDIPSLPASQVTSGLFNVAQIPDLSAAKITAGTFGLAQIPVLDASTKIAANSITANQMAVNSVTTAALLVTSKGQAINDDPAFEDFANAWTVTGSDLILTTGNGSNFQTGVNGKLMVTHFGGAGALDALLTSKRAYAIDPGKTYSLIANLYNAGTRDMYVFVNFFDQANNPLGNAGWGGTMSGYTYGGVPAYDTFAKYGGQFGASTGRPIPANARTVKIGVWFQYSPTGASAPQAAQDIRLERVNDGGLIVDGAITASKVAANAIVAGKIAANAVTAGTVDAGVVTSREILAGSVTADRIQAGSITAAQIASQTITAKHLLLYNSDAVDPDPGFYDSTFWTGADTWPSGVAPVTGDNSYKVSRALHLGQVPSWAANSRPFSVEKDAKYRLRVWIWKNTGTSGNFSPVVHIPGVVYHEMGIPRTGTLNSWAGARDVNWSAIPNAVWTSYDSVITTTVYDYLQFYHYAASLSADVYIAYQLVRMGSADLIVDGSITADKIFAGAVTAGKIAANAVTVGTIDAGAVTAGTIAVGAVSASQIAATDLSSIRSQTGALTITGGGISASSTTGATSLAADGTTSIKSTTATNVARMTLFNQLFAVYDGANAPRIRIGNQTI